MSNRTALQVLMGGTRTSNVQKIAKRAKAIEVDTEEEKNKIVKVEVPGGEKLKPIASWSEMEALLDETGFSKAKTLIDNMRTRFDYPAPSLIQSNAIPYQLQGLPLLATAPTGSGKTFSFIFPLLARLRKPGKKFCRGIILAPTRELVVQIEREICAIAGSTEWRILRAEPQRFKSSSGLKNVDILIGTPGKMMAIINECEVKQFPDCECLILDECDRLLDTEGDGNFAVQIDQIMAALPNRAKQVVMFSATRSNRVDNLASSVLQDPIRITVGNPKAVNECIEQEVVYVRNKEGKVDYIRRLRDEGRLTPPCLIFVDSKDKARGLFHDLLYDGIMVEVLSADRTGGQRDQVVEDFRRGRLWVLICTDVLARGVDFKGVKLVINYDVPQDGTTYIHRVGRTGRAGDKGRAITLVGDADVKTYATITPVLKESGANLPDILLDKNSLFRAQRMMDEERGLTKEKKKKFFKKFLKEKQRKERKSPSDKGVSKSKGDPKLSKVGKKTEKK